MAQRKTCYRDVESESTKETTQLSKLPIYTGTSELYLVNRFCLSHNKIHDNKHIYWITMQTKFPKSCLFFTCSGFRYSDYFILFYFNFNQC